MLIVVHNEKAVSETGHLSGHICANLYVLKMVKTGYMLHVADEIQYTYHEKLNIQSTVPCVL